MAGDIYGTSPCLFAADRLLLLERWFDMLNKMVKKAVEIADYVLAWGCLLIGGSLLVIAVLGIVLPLIVALPLLALAAAYSQKQANDRSVVVAYPA